MAARRINKLVLISSLICGLFVNNVASSWEEYYSSWLENSPEYAGRLYPFGEPFLDDALSYSPYWADAQINFSLPFFGRLFTRAAIWRGGYIELSNAEDATFISKDFNTKWPNQDYPSTNDPPLINAFFTNVELHIDGPVKGAVHWRRLDPSEHSENEATADVTRGMLKHVSSHINPHFLHKPDFLATHGVIVTWHDVMFYACLAGEDCPRNTFQAVVLTDGQETYVVFNYFDLNWAGGLAQGCDPNTGQASEAHPDCFTAQVGFNAGKAVDYYELPYSNTDEVVHLDDVTNVEVKGRFIHEVSSEVIRRGGCADFDADGWVMQLLPESGSMLGGYPVYLSGPCISPAEMSSYTCHFITATSDTQVALLPAAGENNVGKCIAPLLDAVGPISVKLTKDGHSRSWEASHFSGSVDAVVPDVMLDDYVDTWLQPEPYELSLHWEPQLLLDRFDNSSVKNVTVNIRLHAYREYDQKDGVQLPELENEWLDLHVFETEYPNTGNYTFKVADHKCVGVDCDWGLPLPIGFVEVTPHASAYVTTDNRKLWSEPVPLAWYIDKKPSDDGIRVRDDDDDGDDEEDDDQDLKDWAKKKCEKYYEYERGKDEGPEELIEACPMTLTQARSEIGRFIYGAQCNWTHPVKPCPRTLFDVEVSPHITCLPEISPRDDGWRARCCYDDAGNLVYSQDNRDGSAPDRVTPYGQLPYNKPGHLPSLSHWVWDKMFKMLCCKWHPDKDVCIEHYGAMRPTTDIMGYTPSKIAFAYGDPHYRTFDGLEYMFNGRGEFWLLKVDAFNDHRDFMLQARLQKPPEETWGNVRATLISKVAMQEGSNPSSSESPRVIFAVNFEDGLKNNQVLAIVDGELQDFSDRAKMIQIFTNKDKTRRVMIINNSPLDHNDQRNFTVIFQNKIAVQVSNRAASLHVVTHVPPRYYKQTAGLLGVWNGEPSENLQTPDGEVVDPSLSNSDIHYRFGLTWQVSEEKSLFMYRAGLDWDYYSQPDFEPQFSEPSHPNWPPEGSHLTEDMIDEECGTQEPCRFDYKTTLRQDVGEVSREMETWSQEISEMAEAVRACGRIDVPGSRYEFTHYLLGGSMRFTSCETGTMRGHAEYECVESEEGAAKWSPDPDIECYAGNGGGVSGKVAAAIAVPVVVVALVGAGIGGYIFYRRKKKQAPGSTVIRNEEKNSDRVSIGPGDTGLDNTDFNPITPDIDPPRTLSTFAKDVSFDDEGKPNERVTGFNVNPTSVSYAPRSSYENLHDGGHPDIAGTNSSLQGSRTSLASAGYPNPVMTGAPVHGSRTSLENGGHLNPAMVGAPVHGSRTSLENGGHLNQAMVGAPVHGSRTSLASGGHLNPAMVGAPVHGSRTSLASGGHLNPAMMGTPLHSSRSSIVSQISITGSGDMGVTSAGVMGDQRLSHTPPPTGPRVSFQTDPVQP